MEKLLIRIQGYEGEVKEFLLKEICEINPKSSLPDTFEYVDLESVVGTSMVSHRTENKVTAPSRAQRVAKDGDIFYQTVRPYQKNNYLCTVENADYVFSTGYAQLRAKINKEYLFNILQTDSFVGQVLLICTGTSYPAINPSSLSEISIKITEDPSEQQQIASYFKSLDNLIQEATKKISSLKQLKAASLQSMFPQTGKTKPRVRFKGFEGDWKSSKASEIFMTRDERNRPDLPVLSACQDIRGMAPRSISGYDISHDKSNEVTYKRVIPGQFVIHLRSFQGGFAHSSVEGITSPAYTVFGFKNIQLHNDYYWKYVFMSKNFIERLKAITYGIRDGRSISFKEFADMHFIFPSYDEQQHIADFFRSLDTQISLETQRLDKLKQIKSACLDKMFV